MTLVLHSFYPVHEGVHVASQMYNKKKVQRFQGVRGQMHAFGQMYNFFCECTPQRKCTGKSDSRARKSKSRRGRQQKNFLPNLVVQRPREVYTINTWRSSDEQVLARQTGTTARSASGRCSDLPCECGDYNRSHLVVDLMSEALLDSPRRNTRWEELSTLSGPINYAIGRRLEKYFSQCTSGEQVRVPTPLVTIKV